MDHFNEGRFHPTLLPTRTWRGCVNTMAMIRVIEIFYDGIWGTICGDVNWNLVDASVVCKQLGFSGAVATTKQSFMPG